MAPSTPEVSSENEFDAYYLLMSSNLMFYNSGLCACPSRQKWQIVTVSSIQATSPAKEFFRVGLLQTYTRMWADAQRDGHPAEYMWHPLFNAAKFG